MTTLNHTFTGDGSTDFVTFSGSVNFDVVIDSGAGDFVVEKRDGKNNTDPVAGSSTSASSSAKLDYTDGSPRSMRVTVSNASSLVARVELKD